MSEDAEQNQDPVHDAAVKLTQVNGKIAAARVLLARLLQEVVVADSRLSNSQAAQMLEANEQLVMTAVRHQTDADTAARLLAKVSRSAELDTLTQLPNRVLMSDRCKQAMAAAKRHHRKLALLFLDLNGFKQINDTLGHASGDEALKIMAHRLVAAVRDADTVSRHGGDEFLILLTEVAKPSDAGQIANALLVALAAPSCIGDQVLRLTASIGIAMYPRDGDDLQTLLERADAAMYRAKRHGRGNVAFHDPHEITQAGTPGPLVTHALRNPTARYAVAIDDQQRQYSELREANEKLLLSALSAQDMQAAAERAHRHQAEVMALIAEELGNPLAPIRQAAAMLGQMHSAEPLLPRARSIIEKQVQNMTRLVSAVQDFSHASKLAFSLERHTVNLIAVVDAAVATCRPSMDARLQTFTLHLPDLTVHVQGEAARLEQVVKNLLDNASQYTPDLGQIHLTLSVKGEYADLTVSDNGIGVSAIALPTIFEPFSQDIPAIGFRSIGPGIGLTVVRTIVEAHGGTVAARSDGAWRGSQFTVTLPLAQGLGGSYAAATAARDSVSDGPA